MRLRRSVIVCVAVVAMSGIVSTQGNSSAEARLRAAMDKETVDGDLKAAIDGYKKVISQSGASREVVARALLRLGMAYEKQGDAEARKSYERLEREFSDQPTVVQQARVRMAAASAMAASTAATPMLRRLCSGSECPAVTALRDERLVISYAGNRVTAMDLVSGTTRQLAEVPSGRRVCCGAVSSDGRQVAYTVVGGANDPREIVVVNADGSNARTVFRGATAEDWSADGRRILATATGQNW